jgi:hypothetical protein
VAVAADEAGVLAERVAVPDLHERLVERCAGVAVDDGEGQLQGHALLVLADIGPYEGVVEVVRALGELLGECADRVGGRDRVSGTGGGRLGTRGGGPGADSDGRGGGTSGDQYSASPDGGGR